MKTKIDNKKMERIAMLFAIVVLSASAILFLVFKFAPVHATYVSKEDRSFDGVERHVVVLYEDAKIKNLGYIPGVVNCTKDYYIIKANGKGSEGTNLFIAKKDDVTLYKMWKQVFDIKFDEKVMNPALTHELEVAKSNGTLEKNDGFTTVKSDFPKHIGYLNGHICDEPTGKYFNDDVNNIEKILSSHNIPVNQEAEILNSIIYALPNNYNASVKFLQDQLRIENPQQFSDRVENATKGPNAEVLQEIVGYLNNVPYRYENKDDFKVMKL